MEDVISVMTKENSATEIEQCLKEALERLDKKRYEIAIKPYESFLRLIPTAKITHKPFISK